MSCRLSEIATYVNDKVAISKLTLKTYISTENMIQDKGGVTFSSGLPAVSTTQAFKQGDVLVSNIRPYFKKIWLAEFDGGCSNDVLVFRPKEERVSSEFLYLVLSDDAFFDYMMAGSKGTKMPRGDRKDIMNYLVSDFALSNQEQITEILLPLNKIIHVNAKLNDNLEAQASLLYEQVMASNESSCHTLGDIAEITSGKHPETKVEKASIENAIPIVGASDIIGFTSSSLYNEQILVTGRVGTHGIIQRISTASWPSDNTLVIKSKYYEVVYQILRRVNYKSLNRGSTQPLITQKDLKSVEISLPSECKLLECENKLSSIMNLVDHNKLENNKLTTVRDYLLPLLMTGQISLED